jgi:hypothetical protein
MSGGGARSGLKIDEPRKVDFRAIVAMREDENNTRMS